MPDLVPILQQTIGQKTIAAVSARDLHGKLGVKRDFPTWLHQYIDKDDWRKDHDFSVFHLEGENPQGGRPAMDAALSIQMAEHIAMMTRTTKGRDVREYFRRARDERDAGLPASRGDVLVQMAEAYRHQERRLLEVEAAHQDYQRQLLQQQADIIASQRQALDALTASAQANAKADQLAQEQAWMTIHQYVMHHTLEHQMPESLQKSYATYLVGYCVQQGYRIYPQPVAYQRWDNENAYWIGAIKATLEPWLTRRYAQTTLHLIHTQGD